MKMDSVARVMQLIRLRIADLAEGARTPSVRELVSELQVSPNTVRDAFARLAAEGLIDTRPGQGTFARTDASRTRAGDADFGWQSVSLGVARTNSEPLEGLVAIPPPGAINLCTGYLPSELQPVAELRRCLARAASRPGVWDRLPLEGMEELRAWFARASGGLFTANDVIICPGSKPAIAAAFRGLASPGDPIVMESPTYIGAIHTARAVGLRVVPVAVDAAGVRPELLADALATSGARVFYCQPSHSNPSGAVLSSERRRDVLNVIEAARAFLVEDDWARDLHFARRALPPPLAQNDLQGHVVYIRSLTKAAAPGLRVGALMARGPALARLKGARGAEDFYVAGPLQEAALQFVASPAWLKHLSRIRAALLHRRDALASALKAHLGDGLEITNPEGGFHSWLRLPRHCDEISVAVGCARANLVVSPGRHWFPAEPTGAYLRLTFAGSSPDRFAEGAKILANVIESSRPA